MTCQMEAGQRLGSKDLQQVPIFFLESDPTNPEGHVSYSSIRALEIFYFVSSNLDFCFVQ